MSRVKCSNCQELGHFKSKCTNAIKNDDDNAEYSGDMNGGGIIEAGADTNGGADGGWGWGTTATPDDAGAAW